MTFPKITIGMTCFNSADTIGQAIDSAAKQDYQNFEILIVDDGSSDNSVEVIRNKIETIPKARLIIHPQNKGFASALNTLIAEAQGDYLAIFDDDDVSLPQRLSLQIERILKYEEDTQASLIVCHTARIQHYPDGTEFYEPTAGCVDGIAPHGRDIADRILTGRLSRGVHGSCANCSRMASLETFKSVGGFDGNLRRCEDTDFNVRLALAGGHFIGIEKPLVIQSMTGGGEKTLDKEYAAENAMIQKHRDYLSSTGWYEFCMSWLDIKYTNLSGEKLKLLFLMGRLFLRSPFKFIQKLYWALPARKTRNRLVSWYGSSTMEGAGNP